MTIVETWVLAFVLWAVFGGLFAWLSWKDEKHYQERDIVGLSLCPHCSRITHTINVCCVKCRKVKRMW